MPLLPGALALYLADVRARQLLVDAVEVLRFGGPELNLYQRARVLAMLEHRLGVRLEHVFYLPSPRHHRALQHVDALLVARRVRPALRRRQRQQSLALGLPDGDKHCAATAHSAERGSELMAYTGAGRSGRRNGTSKERMAVQRTVGAGRVLLAMNLWKLSVTSLVITSGHPSWFSGLQMSGRYTSCDSVDKFSSGSS